MYEVADYEPLFYAFVEAKASRDDALRQARARLNKAQAEYEAALLCPEVAVYEQARVELTRFRRWAAANGVRLTDPRKTTIPEE